jgi:hypothetical protein
MINFIITSLLVCASVLIPASIQAVCPLCEQLREYHRTHPENNYEFYEDYLKDQAAKAAQQDE